MDNVLTSKAGLRALTKQLSVTAIKTAIGVLEGILNERSKEQEVLSKLKELAETQGFTLEQLGLVHVTGSVTAPISEEQSKRPIKPKFKTLTPASQFFYVENNQLHLLKTHTMKAGLMSRGIELIAYNKLTAKQRDAAEKLIAEAAEHALQSYNAKVDVWNEYAEQHNEERLEKRQ